MLICKPCIHAVHWKYQQRTIHFTGWRASDQTAERVYSYILRDPCDRDQYPCSRCVREWEDQFCSTLIVLNCILMVIDQVEPKVLPRWIIYNVYKWAAREKIQREWDTGPQNWSAGMMVSKRNKSRNARLDTWTTQRGGWLSTSRWAISNSSDDVLSRITSLYQGYSLSKWFMPLRQCIYCAWKLLQWNLFPVICVAVMTTGSCSTLYRSSWSCWFTQ